MSCRWAPAFFFRSWLFVPTMTAESWGSRGWWDRGWAAARWQRLLPWPSSYSSNECHLCPSWQIWALRKPQHLQDQTGWRQCKEKRIEIREKVSPLLFFFFFFTLFPSESNNIGRALAHHLGDVQGAVGLIGYGDRAVNGLGLHLWVMTGARRGHTHGSCVLNLERLLLLSSSSTMSSHTSSGRLSTWPSGPAIPSSNMRFCSWNTRARQLEKETS